MLKKGKLYRADKSLIEYSGHFLFYEGDIVLCVECKQRSLPMDFAGDCRDAYYDIKLLLPNGRVYKESGVRGWSLGDHFTRATKNA